MPDFSLLITASGWWIDERRVCEPMGRLLIGREAPPRVDLHLPAAGVSRNHAEVEGWCTRPTVKDLGSAMGTRVNGERISAPTLLRHNDRVELPSTVITIALGARGEEGLLLAAITAAPWAAPPRQVYADWLEQQGDLPRATYVRAQLDFAGVGQRDRGYAERANALKGLLATVPRAWAEWIALVSISNCGNAEQPKRFTQQCRQRWLELEPRPNRDLRACPTCALTVTLVDSVDALTTEVGRHSCAAMRPLEAPPPPPQRHQRPLPL